MTATINQHVGAIATPKSDKTYRRGYDFKSSLYSVFKQVVARMGISMPALSHAMGYKSHTAINTYLADDTVKTGYAKRHAIQALRDLGATEDEMRALIRAYVIDTGDTSFLSAEGRKTLALKVCDILDSEGELHRPGGVKRSPFVSRRKLFDYLEQSAVGIEQSKMSGAKTRAEQYRAKWRDLYEQIGKK